MYTKLSDILDINIILTIQEAFSRIGVGAQIFDTDGTAITCASGACDFCEKYIKASPLGYMHCQKCDIESAHRAEREGKIFIHRCHAGLVDFTVPILVRGQMVGFFAAGQISTEPLEESYVRKLAHNLGIDEKELVEASKQILIFPENKVQNMAMSMQQLAEIVSSLTEVIVSNIELRDAAEYASKQKADFLANMSHEIRTPLNAVIGMAEIALREEMSERARKYIGQITSSGKTLLSIINDILDYSKIEAGKIDIIEEPYDILELINSLANLIYTQIVNKNIELLADIAPDVPRYLIGDSVRIRQIFTNLANNAAKFTHNGAITIKIECRHINNDIELICSVIDTGIGIKEEDQKKLFRPFQQVDSKRNRSIEGTGLGLALTANLLKLMNGTISLKSKYGEGTTFQFTIPQKQVDEKLCIPLFENKHIKVASLFNSYYLQTFFSKAIHQITSSNSYDCTDYGDIETLIEDKIDFLFIEYPYYTEEIKNLVLSNGVTECIVVVDDYFQKVDFDERIKVLPKPISTLSIFEILSHTSIATEYLTTDQSKSTKDFIIPDVELLIVDDNVVNLSVAKGLLNILKPNITTATSAMEAIELVKRKNFDLILMDHMMPEVDGVEATHRIRALGEAYEQIPIIALTANALNDAKEMLLNEGLNDFIAKPIEMSKMIEVIKRWLPNEKIIFVDPPQKPQETPQETINIPELNTLDGLMFTGSVALYKEALGDFYATIEEKAELISNLEAVEKLSEYVIEVHALKSASRLIGANELSSMAERMELCGKKGEWDIIHSETHGLLTLYRSYLSILKPYAKTKPVLDNTASSKIEKGELIILLDKLECEMQNLDLDQVDLLYNELTHYRFEDSESKYIKELSTIIDNIDFEKGIQLIEEWKNSL